MVVYLDSENKWAVNRNNQLVHACGSKTENENCYESGWPMHCLALWPALTKRAHVSVCLACHCPVPNRIEQLYILTFVMR